MQLINDLPQILIFVVSKCICITKYPHLYNSEKNSWPDIARNFLIHIRIYSLTENMFIISYIISCSTYHIMLYMWNDIKLNKLLWFHDSISFQSVFISSCNCFMQTSRAESVGGNHNWFSDQINQSIHTRGNKCRKQRTDRTKSRNATCNPRKHPRGKMRTITLQTQIFVSVIIYKQG